MDVLNILKKANKTTLNEIKFTVTILKKLVFIFPFIRQKKNNLLLNNFIQSIKYSTFVN